MPGAFVVVEGPDGAGKTTLVARLAARLRGVGVSVEAVRQPGGTPVAEIAREAAFDPALDASPVAELFLVLAARADQVAKVIRPALAAGRLVLSDRYELSTLAYQVEGRGLPREAVIQANALATGGLTPDLTIVLDVPAEVGLGRQTAEGKLLDRMERADRGLHERVVRWFAALNGPNLVHLDASGSVEAVEEAAWRVLCARLRETFPRLLG